MKLRHIPTIESNKTSIMITTIEKSTTTASLISISTCASTKPLRLKICSHCHSISINKTKSLLNCSLFCIKKCVKLFYWENITPSPYSRTERSIFWWQTIKCNMKKFFIIKYDWHNSQFVSDLLNSLKIHINWICAFLYRVQFILETYYTRPKHRSKALFQDFPHSSTWILPNSKSKDRRKECWVKKCEQCLLTILPTQKSWIDLNSNIPRGIFQNLV